MSLYWIGKTKAGMLAAAAAAFVLGVPACYGADVAATPGKECPAAWTFGTEIDVLPYATKGYYGSVVAGHDSWRFRAVAARSTMPSFLVTDGFKDKRTDAYALLADRFLGAKRQKLEGFWVGGGVEYWRNRIGADASPDVAHYNNFVLTLGGGYVWKLSRHFFLNPWAGTHFVVAGERNIHVSDKLYRQPVFTPEASVKVGFTF